MVDKRTFILLFCGLMGILSFYYLRPHIDINAGGAILESKAEVEDRIIEVSQQLGFSADTMALMTMREQHHKYVEFLKDTLEEELTLKDMNERGIHIQSWKSIIGGQVSSNAMLVNNEQLFQNAGNLKLVHSNSGNLIRLHAHRENPNPTFVQGRGDSLQAIAEYIVGDVFDYDLNNYDLNIDSFDNSSTSLNEGRNAFGTIKDSGIQTLEIKWNRKSGVSSGPKELVLNLEPVVKEFDNEDGFRMESGFSVQSFVAKDDYEPVDLNSNLRAQTPEVQWFNYLFFASVLILAIFIFSIGLHSIFKGKVEWRRAIVIFVLITGAVYLWRHIFILNSYSPFLGSTGNLGTAVNNLLFALVVGLYAAMAYISWEALARDQNQKQVGIIDALWQRKFMVQETGAGLINGVGIGGIAIGILSVFLFLTHDFYFQMDSQFGFAEAGISPKLLTMNLSVWSTAFLVCVGQIGFVYTLLNKWIKKNWLSGLLSIVAITFFTAVLGRTMATSSEVSEDLLYYLAISIIFIYALKEFGLLTVFTGWWIFASFFMIQPYLNSPAIELAYVSWVQILLMTSPLVFGFIAYKYGSSINEVGHYIPEYEERLKQHLRVEKEIEIARESQYKLMPLQPPKAEGFDVYGFFLPSFEVGGDYFDYVLSEDEAGKPLALTMAVVDVSGKAMRAAMPAVFTSGLLLSRMKNDMPAKILSQVAEPIYSRTDKRTFITCLLARFDLKTHTLSVANAGHCQPIIKRNGVAEFIQTPDPKYPLGLMADVKYQSQEISLKKGDFILMYSDGLPEAANEKGEWFGFENVPRLVEEIDTDNLSAQEISQEIKRTVQKFSNYQLADDTTIISLKV